MTTRFPHGSATPPTSDLTCLGRTCLQWRADGELIDDDRELVLQRLRRVDGSLTTLDRA